MDYQKQLLDAAKKIIEWYDDEDDRNPHSTEQWKEAYAELKEAVKNVSLNSCVSRSVNPYDLMAIAKERKRMQKKRHCG